jgi:hypothetical protein
MTIQNDRPDRGGPPRPTRGEIARARRARQNATVALIVLAAMVLATIVAECGWLAGGG